MKHWICVAVSFFIFLNLTVWAEENPDSGEPATFKVNVYGVADQPPAVPTTTRFGSQFNTVTEEQIERQGALDFYDALRNVPGVIYQKKNIIGGQTSHSLYIRGRGTTHPGPDLTILFDDVPRFGALYGQALADGISIYALGGMEIYKSPQPSRFGSGYGMINFVPKYATREGFDVNADSRGGSHGTVAENFSLGYKQGNFDIYTAQTWLSSEGHVEHSAGRQAGYYANTGLKASEHWSIRFMGNYVQARTESPNNPLTGAQSYPYRYDTKTGLMTLTFANKFDHASGWIKAYYNNTKFDLLGENAGARWSRQAAKLSGLRGRETFSVWENGEILAGFDLDKLNMTNIQRSFAGDLRRIWDFPDQTVFSPFAAVNYFAGDKDGFHFTPSAGIRSYHNTAFDDAVAPQAGAVFGYRHTDVNFSYARAVNYPSPVVFQGLIEDKPLPGGIDTEKIKPETANHVEIGVTHTKPGKFTLGATWFNDRGKNRTRAFMGGAAPDDASYFNWTAKEFRILGAEVTGKTTPTDSLEIFMGATWLRSTGTGADGIERDRLPYTPDFTFQAGFNWNFARNFSLGGDYQHIQDMYQATIGRTGTSFPELTESLRLPNADVVNLRVDYAFRCRPAGLEKAKIFIAVDNVLNNKYAYALVTGGGNTGYYYMPGTTFMTGVNFGF